jgi:hypothetical protein
MASYHFTAKTYKPNSKITPDYKSLYVHREGKYANVANLRKALLKKPDTSEQEKVLPEDDRTKTDSKLEYINREGKFKETDAGEEVLHKEDGKMPPWAANDHNKFWKAAEDYERENANVFRELEFALPNELTLEQQKEMIAEFIQTVIPQNTYSYAIHSNPATLAPDIQQPHVHLIFSERLNDGIDRPLHQYFRRYNSKYPERGGAKKDRAWAGTDQQRRQHLIEVRKIFADIQNKYLAKYNQTVRVDHRSLKEQREEALAVGDTAKAIELNRPPERKLGPKLVRVMIKNLIAKRKQRKEKSPEQPYDEQAQDQDIHNDEKLNPKIGHNHTIRKIRWVAKQLKAEYEKNAEPEPVDILSGIDIVLPPSYLATVDALKKITIDIEERISSLNTKVDDLEEQKKEIASMVVLELSAERMAKKIYTGKQEKVINMLKKNLEEQALEYKTLLDQHNNSGERPSIFHMKQRAEYDKKTELLGELKTKLDAAQIEFDKKYHDFFLFNSSLKTIAKIEKIQQEILEKNRPIRDEFYTLIREREKCTAIIRHYRTLKNDIREQLTEMRENTNPQFITAKLQTAIQKFKRMCREEQNRQGFGVARLHTDEDTHGRIR